MHNHYIVTTMYHPKPGMEKIFLTFWEEKVLKYSKLYGPVSFSMSYNEETGEFLSITYWKEISSIEKFFESNNLQEITSKINEVCLIPATRETYSILKEQKNHKKAA